MTRARKIFAGATAIAVLTGAGAASAQQFGGGNLYLKGFGGFTLPSGDSTVVTGPGGGGDYKLDYDTGYTLGVAGGYNVSPNIGLELEYAYRKADEKSDIGGNTSSNAVMANAIYNFNPMGPTGAWTPYVGAGLGWANIDVATDDFGDFTRNDAFAYQFIGGVGYAVSPRVKLLTEVRYFGTDNRSTTGDDDVKFDSDFNTVDFLVGATYSF